MALKSLIARWVKGLLLAKLLLLLSFSLCFGVVSFPEVMIILDASGSMLGEVKGETKIEAAKKVLTEVISSLPKEARVGFAVYGHRVERDCQDIEIVAMPGELSQRSILENAVRFLRDCHYKSV